MTLLRYLRVPPRTLVLPQQIRPSLVYGWWCPRRMDLHDDGERHDSLHRPGGIDATAVERLPRCGRRLRRDHFTVLRQAIAEADGREVKNLGDGLMAVFPSASAGLACAVAMQQGVEFDGRSGTRNSACGWAWLAGR